MWLYKSPDPDGPIIIYDYQRTRSDSCPKDFLGEYPQYLQTDGYAGYKYTKQFISCTEYTFQGVHNHWIFDNPRLMYMHFALIDYSISFAEKIRDALSVLITKEVVGNNISTLRVV